MLKWLRCSAGGGNRCSDLRHISPQPSPAAGRAPLHACVQHCSAPCSVPGRRQLCPPTAASATSRCHAGWQALPSALCLPRPGIPPAQSNPCMMQLPCSMMPCCKVRYTWRPPRHPTSRQLEMNLVFVHSLSSHVRCSDTTPAVDCGPGLVARRTACSRHAVYLKSAEVTPAAGAALPPPRHTGLAVVLPQPCRFPLSLLRPRRIST